MKSIFTAVMLLLATFSSSASAALVTFEHTWTGTEALTGSMRLFRDGNASTSTSAKPFPGTFSVQSRFFTLDLNVIPNTVITVTPMTQTSTTFLSIYDSLFNSASLMVNYLGDQGASSVNNIFSILSPASGKVVLVANTVNSFAIGSSFSANINYSPAVSAVPVPAAAWLFASGILGLSGFRRFKVAITKDI